MIFPLSFPNLTLQLRVRTKPIGAQECGVLAVAGIALRSCFFLA
jgi:hypothetical protein